MGEKFRRTDRDRVTFGDCIDDDALEVLITTRGITTDRTGNERKTTRSRCAGSIRDTGQEHDPWQPDERLAGFIQRIQVGPGDGRTGWPSLTHCSNHIEGLILHYRSHHNHQASQGEQAFKLPPETGGLASITHMP